jgi:hypothetical protein
MKQKLISSWQDVTVGQFIDLTTLSQQKVTDEVEHADRAIQIMYGLTPMEVESLSLQEFKQLARNATNIMTSKIEGKPKKVIQGAKNKYKIIYDPKKLTQRQFVEIQYFSGAMIPNMHFIMASLVNRIGRFGKVEPNTAANHEEIANDLLDAKINDVFHACVFFCKLYMNSLVHIQGYLIHEMMQKGATKEQAKTLLNNSTDAMAGSITQKDWLILNV